eukprot:8475-Heterococcus_DN1.PRE.1
MQFAAFVKAAYDEIGVAALDLTMPYDQAAILTENLSYMQSSLQLTELTLHLASEPSCPGGERVVSGVSPGHPALSEHDGWMRPPAARSASGVEITTSLINYMVELATTCNHNHKHAALSLIRSVSVTTAGCCANEISKSQLALICAQNFLQFLSLASFFASRSGECTCCAACTSSLHHLQKSTEMQESCSNSEHAQERSAADDCNPLHLTGILQLVLDLVGPGEHLLLATVSKSFRACYQNVPAVKTMYQDEQGNEVELMLEHEMTAFGAILCSPSRVQQAVELGFVPDFNKGWSQFLAGFFASIETLKELHKQYKMTYTETVCRGAAAAGSVSKLQWLLDEQHCSQPSDLDCFAVHAPTTDVLDWLKQRGW